MSTQYASATYVEATYTAAIYSNLETQCYVDEVCVSNMCEQYASATYVEAIYTATIYTASAYTNIFQEYIFNPILVVTAAKRCFTVLHTRVCAHE
jgi:hypothetical protein